MAKTGHIQPPAGADADAVRAGLAQIEAFAERWRADPELRARIEAGGARDALREYGVELPQGAEARVAEDTETELHIVFPPDPNAALSDETLDSVGGGARASTASSAGTVSTIPSCAACMSSLGSVALDRE